MRKVFLRKITLMSALVLMLCSANTVGVPEMSSKAAEGDVEINETNFPDANFRNYVEQSVDVDKDKVLSQEEKDNVKDISVTDGVIKDVKGIEYFTNLETLFLTNNNIKSIDLSKNTNLLEIYIADNILSDIDLSNNLKLEKINISTNPISEIDVTQNKNLKMIQCYDTNLKILDLTNNDLLESVVCSDNEDLTSLKLSEGCTSLRIIDCASTSITELNVEKCTALSTLECSKTEISQLNLSANTNLITLKCGKTNLTSLDVSNNLKLTDLYCDETGITSLDISNNPYLMVLDCADNQLTQLDLSANVNLESAEVYNNRLTSLDLSPCSKINKAILDGNKYEIVLKADNTFDLTTLPEGFDVSKASDWKGGTVDGNILTVDEGGTIITYVYDCGMNQTTTFTLINSVATHTHDFNSIKSDETNHWHVCSICDVADTKEAHTYGSDNKCTICGYEKVVVTTEETTTEESVTTQEENTTTESNTGAPEASIEPATTETVENVDNAVSTGDATKPIAMMGVMVLAFIGTFIISIKLKKE